VLDSEITHTHTYIFYCLKSGCLSIYSLVSVADTCNASVLLLCLKVCNILEHWKGYLWKLFEAVSGDDQFAGENLKGFVLERLYASSYVYIFIATERGNQRDFYHAFKSILSALPQRISGTFYITVMKPLVKVKVNVSLCKPKMDVTDWSCISMYSSSRF